MDMKKNKMYKRVITHILRDDSFVFTLIELIMFNYVLFDKT